MTYFVGCSSQVSGDHSDILARGKVGWQPPMLHSMQCILLVRPPRMPEQQVRGTPVPASCRTLTRFCQRRCLNPSFLDLFQVLIFACS
jgi:hypothetical protein